VAPQGIEVLGLQYATSNVGACHTKATLPFYEGRMDPAHHVEWTKQDQDYVAVVDSGVLCWIIYHGPLWGEKPSSAEAHHRNRLHRRGSRLIGERYGTWSGSSTSTPLERKG